MYICTLYIHILLWPVRTCVYSCGLYVHMYTPVACTNNASSAITAPRNAPSNIARPPPHYTLHPTSPYTTTPYSLLPTPYTLHPTPYAAPPLP